VIPGGGWQPHAQPGRSHSYDIHEVGYNGLNGKTKQNEELELNLSKLGRAPSDGSLDIFAKIV